MMKLPILLSALLLLASPALADDYLYLKCKQSIDMVFNNSTTSKIVEDRTIDVIETVKIDFAKKTLQGAGAEEPLSFTIKNKIATMYNKIDNDEMQTYGVIKINLVPPYSISSEGMLKDKNISVTTSTEGLCERVDVSVWDEAIKQSEN